MHMRKFGRRNRRRGGVRRTRYRDRPYCKQYHPRTESQNLFLHQKSLLGTDYNRFPIREILFYHPNLLFYAYPKM